MSKVHLYSEPFAKTGNMAAEGFRKLLGRPALGLMQTLVREGIQNVLDAAHDDSSPTVHIRLRTLTAGQHDVLSKRLLAERPQGEAASSEINASLRKSGLRVLEICDFGTEGLSGPTRADTPHDGDEPLNFVNFLRNVGASRDTHHGGGTYGYGKSSLYAMSGCSTIVVDSQTRYAGDYERRLMACHLGLAFDAKGKDGTHRRYTGRHWWGVLDGKDSVEPIIDEDAVALSAAVGFPVRKKRDTGTSILIIDPLIDSEDPRLTADDLLEAVLWNFWPRMTGTTPPNRKLKVTIEIYGAQVAIPAPEEFPPLDLFAAAMAVHRNRGEKLRPIWCGSPKKLLGHYASTEGMRAQRRGPANREESLIPTQVSHIALMRPIELVVKYIEGEALPDRRFEWAGVFICSDDDEVEEAFALAEPPAHDDWIPDNLPKGRAKTFVRVALRELNEIARPQAGQMIYGSSASEEAPSLAGTATKMGAFLDRTSATGPGKSPRVPTGGSRKKTLSISPPRFVGLQKDSKGRAVARFLADLNNDGSDASLHVVAEPCLVVDGGSTANDDLPESFELTVAQITIGTSRKSGAWIHAGHNDGIVEVLVPTVPGAAITVKLRLQSGRPE